jgi:N-sulfoglucosamine sulfohydrolase
LNNLANDPAYQKTIKIYNAKLKDWMDKQDDKGAAVDIIYNKDN